MKGKGRKLLALLLCLVLVCGLITTASGSANVYFMAVNDTLVPVTQENMPIVVGGTLYVPYIMFSLRHNGNINLGITAQYSTTRRTVMVSQGQRAVIFDPIADACYDLDGVPLDGRAILRNSMAYIPLDWVCEHFGIISYSVVRTAYGTLVRVTNHLAIYSDGDFVKAAAEMLKENYRDYLKSLDQSGRYPSGGGPVESGRPETGPVVYPAFVGGNAIGEVAQILEDHNQRGLFLLTVEEMSRDRALIRRLVGAGHLVGLNITNGDLSAALVHLEEGRRLMAEEALYYLTVVRLPDEDPVVETRLREQGCALWQAGVFGDEAESADGLLAQLTEEGTYFVEFSCSPDRLKLLEAAMEQLAGNSYRLRLTTAAVL